MTTLQRNHAMIQLGRGGGRVRWGLASVMGAVCGEVQRHRKTHALCAPCPPLCSVILGTGRRGWAVHGGRAAALGLW